MRREVQLKPGFAQQYPSLIPGRWYAASAVASLIHSGNTAEAGADRPLDPGHFLFRGGISRSGPSNLRTRRQDRHADLSLF